MNLRRTALEGLDLSAEQASVLERRLVECPTDLAARGGALTKWRADLAARRRPDFDQAFLYR